MEHYNLPQSVHAAPAHAYPARRRGPLIYVVVAFASLIALLFGLLTLWLIGFETGVVPLLAGMIIAALPVPFYLTLVLWLDRYESEPFWMLAASFFWGALVAVFFAIILNSVGGSIVEMTFGEETATFYGLVISAPLVEESAKAIALFALFFWKRDEFDGVLDGIIYAAMVGLGFAMTENVKYYGSAVLDGQAVGTFILRGLFSPFAHPLFTAMTGIGLGLAAHTRSRVVRYLVPPLGLCAAMLLHSAWNASAYFAGRFESGLILLASYFLVMVPIFIGLLVVIILALRHEGRILREHLRAECERGLLTADEYARLCSVRGRMGASYDALKGRGMKGWRTRKQLHRAASELAFHRHRVARGIVAGDGSDAEREAVYLRQIDQLRGGPDERR